MDFRNIFDGGSGVQSSAGRGGLGSLCEDEVKEGFAGRDWVRLAAGCGAL